MEVLFVIIAAVAFLITGTLFYYLEAKTASYFVATLVPLVLLIGIVLFKRDEFGYWALLLSFGICCSLIGSTAGILLAKKVRAGRLV